MGTERELAKRIVVDGLLGADEIPPAPPKYEIERRLGQGGGGEVYQARDTTLGRSVALKYLRGASPLEVERFLREARFAARLDNPAIVRVYEAGEVEGVPFIAMQYVPGRNLGEIDLDIEATVRVARQVADALRHAHREGIVHRDIKPENILVDDEGRAYVTDFGIARDLRGELGATISQEGQIMGTPALMPPEQARGEVEAVDARSDIYALGATLFHKLTGRLPFKADNVVDLLHAVLHVDPPLPRSLHAAIPRELEAIVVRCMKKRRSDRYPSMGDVVRAFDGYLRGARDAPVASPWFAAYVRGQVEDAPEPERADDDSEAEPQLALEVAREIAGWDTNLYRVSRDLPRTFPKLDAVVARLDRTLEERPATGWARFYRGVARFRRGDLDGAREDMERSIDRVKDAAPAYFELGRLYLALHLEEAHRARQHISRAGTEHDLLNARSRARQAALAFQEAARAGGLEAWRRRFGEAVERFADGDLEGCAATCEEIVADDPDLEEVWKLLGDVRRALGQDPATSYGRAVDIRRSYYEALVALAAWQLDGDDAAAARATLDRTVAIHPGHAGAHALLARALLREGEGEGALAAARTAVDVDPRSYDAVVTSAEVYLATGAVDDALATLATATGLGGCQNRVNYLRARALLQRARATGSGADVDAVLTFRDSPAFEVPDNEPWAALLAEAETVKASLDSTKLDPM